MGKDYYETLGVSADASY